MSDIRYDGEIPLGEIHIIEETNRNFKLSSKVLESEEIYTVLLASINKVYSDFLGYENNGLILSKEGQIVFDLLEKINKYKSIEEELGCPLEFAITPYRMSGLKKIWYHNQWCDVVRIVCYEEATKPYMEVRCKDYKYLKMIFLQDHKKTWWLSETKEE